MGTTKYATILTIKTTTDNSASEYPFLIDFMIFFFL